MGAHRWRQYGYRLSLSVYRRQLLDASHVALVHVSSFAGAGTGNLPLDIEKLDDGVIVSR